MNCCYTVCSLNRLGQIRVLADSFLLHHPGYLFFACLADEIDGRINPEDFPDINFIPLSALKLEEAPALSARYTIFELSCALKPYFGNHLLHSRQPQILVYLDTDIAVYHPFGSMEALLHDHDIMITPHFVSPPPQDGRLPLERDVLNSGLYNGGFFAVKNSEGAASFLNWWQQRLYDQGYNNVCEGMMVDQLWLNLAPLYFKGLKVFDDPGYNLAYWNLHERTLEKSGEAWSVNGKPLVFFHFSGYRFDAPERLSLHQNRIGEGDYPALQALISQYHRALAAAGFDRYLPLAPKYGSRKNKPRPSFVKRKAIAFLARFGYALEKIRKA